tara:strand:- start:10 stop:348 length:339 start_codon:yes stop_codon:yes gene_type:complete
MGLAKAWLGAVAVTAVGIALYFALLHSPRPTRSSAAASKDVSETHTRGVSEVAQDGSAILTKDQLALHDGSDSSLPIYLGTTHGFSAAENIKRFALKEYSPSFFCSYCRGNL